MSVSDLGAPATSEYDPYYALYVDRVPEGNILETLERLRGSTAELLRSIPEERGTDRYAEGKWSIKELVGHVIDVERVFATRALAFGRGDTHPLPSFEQDAYIEGARFDTLPLEDLVREFETLRASNILMFQGFDADAAMRKGMASGCEFTARAIPWILAGHELHHVAVLKERYLQSL